MGIFSKFENKMEDAIDDLGDKFFDSPISPVQISKKAEKQMRRNKMLGAGKQYAPTLYTVLVNKNDDARLFGYYPTLAGETETYLKAKANEAGFAMDGDPLVRFIVDDDLKSGKFDVIAEAVASEIINQLRAEENERYSVGAQNRQASAPQNNFQDNNINQPVPSNQQTPQAKMSSPFSNDTVTPQSGNAQVNNPFPDNNLSVDSAVQNQDNIPVNPAPQNADIPKPEAAVAVPPMPQPAPAVDVPTPNPPIPQASNPAPVNPPVSSSAETAVFSGGFDVPLQPQRQPQNVAVPPAVLYEAATGRSYQITSPTTVLGRDNSCNVVLADANASRQHAQITFNQGLWLINDLGSTNGTFVNNQEVTTRELHPGDLITIGVSKLTFNLS